MVATAWISIDGGVDDDTISGDAGNDTITGGEGADSLYGGDDRDIFLGGSADNAIGGEGGDDNDTLIVANVREVIYDPLDHERGTVYFLDGTTQTFSEIENVVITDGNDGFVDGTAGGDLIDVNYTGDPDGDRVDAGDNIFPGKGPNDDIIRAGDGDDFDHCRAGRRRRARGRRRRSRRPRRRQRHRDRRQRRRLSRRPRGRGRARRRHR